MSDTKYPETERSDIDFGPIPSVTKEMGEVFLEASNLPNNPKKDHQPTSFNVTDDYPGKGKGDDDE